MKISVFGKIEDRPQVAPMDPVQYPTILTPSEDENAYVDEITNTVQNLHIQEAQVQQHHGLVGPGGHSPPYFYVTIQLFLIASPLTWFSPPMRLKAQSLCLATQPRLYHAILRKIITFFIQNMVQGHIPRLILHTRPLRLLCKPQYILTIQCNR